MDKATQHTVPPLKLAWAINSSVARAVAGDSSLYGITTGQRIIAVDTGTGRQRWQSAGLYLTARLARQGSRLFAYKANEGLAYVDDAGDSATERLVMSFGATDSTNLSTPISDGRMVYAAVNRGMIALHQDNGFQFSMVLGEDMPFEISLVSSREIIVLNGFGVPTRYRVTDTEFETVWTGASHGLSPMQMWRPMVIAGNRCIVGLGPDVVAYNLSNGAIAWHLENVPARSFTASGDTVYAAFHAGALWAIRISDGAILWHRQYLADPAVHRENGLALLDDYLYYGGALQGNPDGTFLLSVKASDGSFAWLSRSPSGDWTGGLPLVAGSGLFCYGGARNGAYVALSTSPRVTPDMVQVAPRPLRGPSSSFGTGTIRAQMPVAARVSIAPYRETTGLGSVIVNGANWRQGLNEASWTVGGSGGFTDTNQIGYMLVDVTEGNGNAYTQALLLPVNTFPDIAGHWARSSIETMIYHKHVGGYPDQTFKPDNLLTRAESCSIIAKTLGLQGPTPGFQTSFSDISSHWARDSIMALEERHIVNGFSESDGRFTFRPDLNMTRAQEARILVRAYAIPAAPGGFSSRFTDIAGHWAADDIKALEAAGYVNGFREPNGTYTYRPDQNLTRAELCAIVVRILRLTR